jgi:hypothetical protein
MTNALAYMSRALMMTKKFYNIVVRSLFCVVDKKFGQVEKLFKLFLCH